MNTHQEILDTHLLNIFIIVTDIEIYISIQSSKLDRSSIISPEIKNPVPKISIKTPLKLITHH